MSKEKLALVEQAAPVVDPSVAALDQALTAAIDTAKNSGMTQGYVVALLQAHALRQTQLLLA